MITTRGRYENGVEIATKKTAVEAVVASIILVRFENESRWEANELMATFIVLSVSAHTSQIMGVFWPPLPYLTPPFCR